MEWEKRDGRVECEVDEVRNDWNVCVYLNVAVDGWILKVLCQLCYLKPDKHR